MDEDILKRNRVSKIVGRFGIIVDELRDDETDLLLDIFLQEKIYPMSMVRNLRQLKGDDRNRGLIDIITRSDLNAIDLFIEFIELKKSYIFGPNKNNSEELRVLEKWKINFKEKHKKIKENENNIKEEVISSIENIEDETIDQKERKKEILNLIINTSEEDFYNFIQVLIQVISAYIKNTQDSISVNRFRFSRESWKLKQSLEELENENNALKNKVKKLEDDLKLSNTELESLKGQTKEFKEIKELDENFKNNNSNYNL